MSPWVRDAFVVPCALVPSPRPRRGMSTSGVTLAALVSLTALVTGCNPAAPVDAGTVPVDVSPAPLDALTYDVPSTLPDGGAVTDGGASTDAAAADVVLPPGFLPAPSAPYDNTTSAPGSIQVSVSGESLAERGYDFTTSPTASQTVFVDGWSLRFERYLVVLDHVRLNQPGADTTMQSAVGALVAQQNGPWMVNLHAHGILAGAGGPPETATPVFVFTGPSGGGSFDPTVRYAFSYDTVPASAAVHNVNLVAADGPDAAAMIAHGWTKFFRGTATYQGDPPPAGSPLADYPTVVQFAFGFSDPAAYINCENPDLMMAGSMDVPRGIQPSATGRVRAQITLHTDHFFWDQTDIEGTPPHFDPLAARATGSGSAPGTPHTVTLADLAGDNPTALTDILGRPVPNRVLGMLESSMGDLHPPPGYGIGAAGAAVIRDLRDFVTYNARGQGHLNSNGLCYVQPTAPLGY